MARPTIQPTQNNRPYIPPLVQAKLTTLGFRIRKAVKDGYKLGQKDEDKLTVLAQHQR
ncbi:hypothetical protein HDV02_002455 [Globomyces sp. JEL0801]|nr:hypothetical protein HDV02_002455 [Globomyces sp. JEL0801]